MGFMKLLHFENVYVHVFAILCVCVHTGLKRKKGWKLNQNVHFGTLECR